MKKQIVLGLALLCAVGCTTNRNKMSTGRVASPIVEDVDAHLKVGQAIEGSGKINTLEILGIHFTGGINKKVGSIGNGLYVDTKTPILNPMRLLFGSPANVNAAIDSAYYDAVDKSNADGLISTRVKSQKTGFTLLHIIGWGTATADVKGHEVSIKEGQLPRSSSAPTFIQR
jgi:hypothetical protein